MPTDEWPNVPIQKALLRSFAKWLSREGKYGLYHTEPGKAKLVKFDEVMIERAVDNFVFEQQDGVKRSPL